MKLWRNASTGTPGVYRYRETPGVAVTGPSSGIPLFIGFSDKGFPAGSDGTGEKYSPLVINSWSQFVYAFGGTCGKFFLAYAVRGFFSNDGTTCCVVGIDPGKREEFPSELNRVLTDIHNMPDLENVDLVCVPDIVLSGDIDGVCGLQRTVLDFCRGRGVFQGNDHFRFAVLDSINTTDGKQVTSQRMSISSPDGALYYPWIRLADGPGASGGLVPPSGHLAGIYARSDRRTGVHKAPANEIVEEAMDLGADITGSLQDLLNPVNVNCLRSFPGRGIRVWGARTLSTDSDWRYINVRRLFLAVCRRTEKILAAMVFEPNDARLWMRITRELNACLTDLYRKGAFAGETIEQAFYVKCDAETNNTDMRDRGELMVEIGLAAAIPGEYIVIRIVQTDGGMSVSSSADTIDTETPGISITRIVADPSGADVNGEYVMLRNNMTISVDMTGWQLLDRAGHRFVFPLFVLEDGAEVRIWTQTGENSVSDLYWGHGADIWNNTGDTAYLYDSQNRPVSTLDYTAESVTSSHRGEQNAGV